MVPSELAAVSTIAPKLADPSSQCKTQYDLSGLFLFIGERAVFIRGVFGVIVNIFAVFEKRRGHRPRFAVRAANRRAAVLREVNAAHAVGFVRAAAMKQITVKSHDAAGGNDERIAGIRTGVADEVVRALFLVMIDDLVLGAAA